MRSVLPPRPGPGSLPLLLALGAACLALAARPALAQQEEWPLPAGAEGGEGAGAPVPGEREPAPADGGPADGGGPAEGGAADGGAADGGAAARVEAGLRTSLLEGVVYEDPEAPIRLHLGGLFALDLRLYDERNVNDNELRLDRALVHLDLQSGPVWVRVVPDLIGTDTKYGLDEAWVAFEPWFGLRLQAGLLHVPLAIHSTIPEGELPFVDYSFDYFVTDRTDWGARLMGELGEGLFSYSLTGVVGEGFDGLGQRREEPELVARVATYPFRWVDPEDEPFGPDWPLLGGFFLAAGVRHSWGYDAELDVPNSLRTKLFFSPRIRADRSLFHGAGYGFDFGRLRVIHEFYRGSLFGVERSDGTEEDVKQELHTWQVTASFRITGEPYDTRLYRQLRTAPQVAPGRPLLWAPEGQDGIGVVEVAVRYANGDIAREFEGYGFPFSTERFNSQEFRTFDAAINWWPVQSVRITAQITRTLADQFPPSLRSHGRDTSGVIRVQLSF